MTNTHKQYRGIFLPTIPATHGPVNKKDVKKRTKDGHGSIAPGHLFFGWAVGCGFVRPLICHRNAKERFHLCIFAVSGVNGFSILCDDFSGVLFSDLATDDTPTQHEGLPTQDGAETTGEDTFLK